MPKKAIPSTRTVTLPRSGQTVTYELERKAVKNLNLRVRRDGTVHLSVPRRTTESASDAFLREREEWLLSALASVRARTEAHPTVSGTVENTLPYLGGTLSLTWQTGSPAEVQVDMEAHRLTVRLPDPEDSEMRRAAVEVFEKAETERLVRVLVDRYHPLLAPLGVAYPVHIRVKHLRSRFGSCAPQTGSLNFSSRLCEYPLAFAEYVVVHELCHFLVPNHSAAFWREVSRILPDYATRAALGKQ